MRLDFRRIVFIVSKKKKIIIGVFLLLLLISIPLTLSLVSRQQETRSRASTGTTTLYFEPSTSVSTPMTKNVGDTISLDLVADPGSNLVTFVRYQITYDPTKLQLDTTNPITLNSTVFSSVEGPVTTNGTIAQSVSIGSDPTKAIQKATKIGTVNFKAIGPTGDTPTTISFGNLTQALSSSQNDQASQNVLSSTTPANVIITGTSTITPSIPQPSLSGTVVSFTVVLHGVGIGGDNPNPNGNSLSNKNPVHPQRDLSVEVTDTNNQVVASASAPISYDAAAGTFTGKMSLGDNVPAGNYNIRIKTDRYLRRLVPGIQQIKVLQENKLPITQLIAGDTNGDNFLNVIDYNALLDCGFGLVEPLPMTDANAPYNSQNCQVHTPAINVDIDDNGIINSFDYNLFLRELSVQNGD